MNRVPQRKSLPHEMLHWVSPNATYFITICCNKRHVNQLCQDSIANQLWESVVYRQELGQWHPQLFLLMPDHLHMLVGFSSDVDIQKTVSSWKRYAATKVGIGWQRGFFEHRIRNTEVLIQKREYIQHNPVRAGLTESSENWKYCWEMVGES